MTYNEAKRAQLLGTRVVVSNYGEIVHIGIISKVVFCRGSWMAIIDGSAFDIELIEEY
ncbi:MAG: hypothetical protein GOVbin631_35 [Prokaryotic dsDNA virus sp.]|nr:MAG: hypothetical protein GOVbin631_35 [Prokaryotic dsDNA virus sp.]|tara:strand:+ start:13980 stop:14153 length:174 start_codon:yes stop_codon:yes gene_type:complete